jgi:ferritin-like metal-binding protein YciE
LATKLKQTEDLSEEQVRELFFAGLQRLYAAYGQNEAASVANGEDAHDQELKRTLQTGTKKDHEQGKRLLVVFEAVGLKPDAAQAQKQSDSGVLEAGREEIAAAEEGMPRDLVIIAAEQAFAQACLVELVPLHTHARVLKNDQVARHLHRMMNDTKQLEETVTKLAARLIKQASAVAAASVQELPEPV